MKFTKRIFNSPLVRYTNFKDGSFINLIRIAKPYADGRAWAVYCHKDPEYNNMYKSKEAAEAGYKEVVNMLSQDRVIREYGHLLHNELNTDKNEI